VLVFCHGRGDRLSGQLLRRGGGLDRRRDVEAVSAQRVEDVGQHDAVGELELAEVAGWRVDAHAHQIDRFAWPSRKTQTEAVVVPMPETISTTLPIDWLLALVSVKASPPSEA